MTLSSLISNPFTISGVLGMTIIIGFSLLVARSSLTMQIEFVMGWQLMVSLLGFTSGILSLADCPQRNTWSSIASGFIGLHAAFTLNLRVMCQCRLGWRLLPLMLSQLCLSFLVTYVSTQCCFWLGWLIPILRTASMFSVGFIQSLLMYLQGMVVGLLVRWIPGVQTLISLFASDVAKGLAQPFTAVTDNRIIIGGLLGLVTGAVLPTVIILFLATFLKEICEGLDVNSFLDWGPSVPIVSSLYICLLLLLPEGQCEILQEKKPEPWFADMIKAAEKDPDHGSGMRLKTVDFAGQEIYYAMHHIFLPGTAVYLVVFNLAEMCSNFSNEMKKL